MKRLLFIIMLVMASACSRPVIVQRYEPMKIFAMTKSAVDYGTDTPVFLFWLDSDFAAIGEDVFTQPYLEAWPPGVIDSYKTTTYDTGKTYPDNGQVVCCTGYYPATLIVDGGNSRKSWTSLEVPVEEIGLMDVMVAPEHITGKNTLHFDTKEPKEPLEFIHAQSKIMFKAKMGTEMATNRYLRNIKITIPGSELMSTLKWENGRYIASETSGDNVFAVLNDPSSTQLDPSQKPREVGSIYIYPGQSSLKMRVEVEISDTPLFVDSEIVFTETEIDFNLDDAYGSVLRENDAYEILMLINYDSIILKGRKAEWDEGGEVLIPIYPNITTSPNI